VPQGRLNIRPEAEVTSCSSSRLYFEVLIQLMHLAHIRLRFSTHTGENKLICSYKMKPSWNS